MKADKLLELDQLFSDSVNNTNLNSWVSTFAAKGFMLSKTGEPTKGHNAIQLAMTSFFNLPDLKFSWSPEGGSLSDDASLGYTYGTYNRSWTKDDGDHIKETGRYVTIWRLQEDGHYLIEMDMGN